MASKFGGTIVALTAICSLSACQAPNTASLQTGEPQALRGVCTEATLGGKDYSPYCDNLAVMNVGAGDDKEAVVLFYMFNHEQAVTYAGQRIGKTADGRNIIAVTNHHYGSAKSGSNDGSWRPAKGQCLYPNKDADLFILECNASLGPAIVTNRFVATSFPD